MYGSASTVKEHPHYALQGRKMGLTAGHCGMRCSGGAGTFNPYYYYCCVIIHIITVYMGETFVVKN